MSNIPSGGSSNYRMSATTTGNGFALASLLCSILLFCLPGVGGLLAVIFGIVGMKRAKVTNNGNGMAIAGIIIGIIGLIFWGICVATGGVGYFFAKKAIDQTLVPAQAAATQYVIDVSSGNIDAAAGESQLSKEDITAQHELLKPLGAFQSLSHPSLAFNEGGGWKLVGTATFANGSKKYTIELSGAGTSWKIYAANFE